MFKKFGKLEKKLKMTDKQRCPHAYTRTAKELINEIKENISKYFPYPGSPGVTGLVADLESMVVGCRLSENCQKQLYLYTQYRFCSLYHENKIKRKKLKWQKK